MAHAVTVHDWLAVVLVLVFAYGGFEAVFFATGETRDPRRDAPAALGYALALVTVIYTLVQVVINGTLENPAATERPLADAARHIFGGGAAAAIAGGALVSIYGYLGANMLHTPRLTFALAERGDFPRFFAAVHPKFRTPHVSIMLYTALLLGFTLLGNFRWNITLSAVARLLTYSSFAVALLVLRRKQPQVDAFRVPAGSTVAILTLAFCATVVHADADEQLVSGSGHHCDCRAQLATGSQERHCPRFESLVQIGKRFSSRQQTIRKFRPKRRESIVGR